VGPPRQLDLLPADSTQQKDRHGRVRRNPGTQRPLRDSLGAIRLCYTFYSSVNPSFLPLLLIHALRVAATAANPASRRYLATATIEPPIRSGTLRANSLLVYLGSSGGIDTRVPTNSSPWKQIRRSPWTDRNSVVLRVRTRSPGSPSSQFHFAPSVLEFGALEPGIDLLRRGFRRGGWTAAVSCGRREEDGLSPSDVSWTVAIRAGVPVRHR
jgi:hypothetical protein